MQLSALFLMGHYGAGERNITIDMSSISAQLNSHFGWWCRMVLGGDTGSDRLRMRNRR
jgi:hypothetical protein